MSSYTNDTKPSGSYTDDTKPSMTADFLLKEDTFFLLLETGNKILLNQSTIYGNDTKNSNSWSNDSK